MEGLMYLGYFTADGIESFEGCRRSRYRVIHKYRFSWVEDTWKVAIKRRQAKGAVGSLRRCKQARRSLKRDVLVPRDVIGDSGRREASASFAD